MLSLSPLLLLSLPAVCDVIQPPQMRDFAATDPCFMAFFFLVQEITLTSILHANMPQTLGSCSGGRRTLWCQTGGWLELFSSSALLCRVVCTYTWCFKGFSGSHWFQFLADENQCCSEFSIRTKLHMSQAWAECALPFLAVATAVTVQTPSSKINVPNKLSFAESKRAGFKN